MGWTNRIKKEIGVNIEGAGRKFTLKMAANCKKMLSNAKNWQMVAKIIEKCLKLLLDRQKLSEIVTIHKKLLPIATNCKNNSLQIAENC